MLLLFIQSQIKGPVDQYNPYNYDESFATEYGGFGEGGVLVGLGSGGGGGGGGGGSGGMRTPGVPRGGPERELKIPTLVRDVPRPLSPPRHRYRTNSYERDVPPPSLMGVGQPVRGPGYLNSNVAVSAEGDKVALFVFRMYHEERLFREEDRGHQETTQVSIPKDVSFLLLSLPLRVHLVFFFNFPTVGRSDHRQRGSEDPQDPRRFRREHHDR